MKNLHMLAGASALALIASPCVAQTAGSVQAPAGYAPMQAPCVKQSDGSCLPVSAANPLPVTGGTGGGDASAANQTAIQANAGADAAKVVAVQGVTGGKPLTVNTIVAASAADRGAAVAIPGIPQQLMAANASRRGFSVQNQSTGACYINGQATATQDYHSLQIAAGAYYETSSTHVAAGAISVVCAVAGASVYAREW